MNDIARALMLRLTTLRGKADAHTLVGGRIYRTAAPDKTPFPYIVFTFVGGPIWRVFGGNDIDDFRIQFSVFAEHNNDAEPVTKIWDALTRALEEQTLKTLDGTFLQMRREGLPRELIDSGIIHISGDWLCERQAT